MNKRDRVTAALSGETPDRIPAAFWFHFTGENTSGQNAINAHIDYFKQCGCDMMKIMSDSYFDYAASIEVNTTADWYKLKPLGTDHPFYAGQIARAREIAKEVKKDFITWDYSECLIIDRKSGTLEYIQNIGTDSNITFKYKINDGIVNLLERFDARKLFKHIKGNFEDVIENPNETRDYIITIDYTKSPSRIITGSYDKNGLPEDFLYFVETITNFIKYYNMQEMFNPFVYGKVKRRKSEYIFCSVIFKGGYKSYYYLTDDDSIEIGDLCSTRTELTS